VQWANPAASSSAEDRQKRPKVAAAAAEQTEAGDRNNNNRLFLSLPLLRARSVLESIRAEAPTRHVWTHVQQRQQQVCFSLQNNSSLNTIENDNAFKESLNSSPQDPTKPSLSF